jgi:hypothetical protein
LRSHIGITTATTTVWSSFGITATTMTTTSTL